MKPHLPQFERESINQEMVGTLKLCNSVMGDHDSFFKRFASLEHY